MQIRILHDYPKEDLPREKLIEMGAEVLTDSELLAIIIGSGSKENNVLKLSKEIIKKFPMPKLNEITLKNLTEFKGISVAKACKVIAALEIAKRSSVKNKNPHIRKASDVFDLVSSQASSWKQERFIVLLLNTRNKLIRMKTLSIGTLNSNVIHSRNIFFEAINENAAGVIICHNHPSGDPEPSNDDIDITKEIVKGGDFLGIPVLDHVIIGNNDYFSMKEKDII
ncbi:MAG: RadC family protein [Candidatus Woesearchaeota archaeon]